MRIQPALYGVVKTDVPVLVPGIGLYKEDGEPYSRGMARVAVVENSIVTGRCIPELYLTGGVTDAPELSEADQLEQELIRRVGKQALVATTIIKESESTNSLLNFINIADTINQLRPEALSVVTDWAHMPRVLTIARKIMPKTTTIFPVISAHVPNIYETLREVPALPATFATLFMTDSGNTTQLHNRVEKYINTKSKVKRALRRPL